MSTGQSKSIYIYFYKLLQTLSNNNFFRNLQVCALREEFTTGSKCSSVNKGRRETNQLVFKIILQ